MRVVILGLLVSAGLFFAVAVNCSSQDGVLAQRPEPPQMTQGDSSNQLIALSAPPADGIQQVVLIYSNTRSMSVYHIELATGEIALKGVRRFHWDLQMEEYNGQEPLPREIRALIERR